MINVVYRLYIVLLIFIKNNLQNSPYIADLNLTDDQFKTYALCEIDEVRRKNGKSLMSICIKMCPSDIFNKHGHNKVTMKELNYMIKILANFN